MSSESGSETMTANRAELYVFVSSVGCAIIGASVGHTAALQSYTTLEASIAAIGVIAVMWGVATILDEMAELYHD